MNPNKTLKVTVEVEMKPVESSNMAFVGYIPMTGALYVEFKQGTTYLYHNVPQKVYTELMVAESHGKYLNASIKGAYQYTKVA